MKNTRTEFKLFSVPQWKQEQEYLRHQHKNGWRFVSVSFLGFYHFEKCEPEDVVYQLDYNPEGAAHKTEYVQLFQDCGWEYLQDFWGYSYFRKATAAMDGDEEIFCDDSSRLDFMKRVFKGRMIPLLVIFFCIIIPQLALQANNHSVSGGIFTGVFTVLGILYLVLFLVFAVQFWKYWKS